MELLLFLCARQGQVIGADELIRAVWGGRPMADNPVYKSVAKLRRALGDDAANPRYIATVAKRGYRLLATVEPLSADELSSPGTSRGFEGKSRRRAAALLRRSLPVAAGMLAGVVLAVIVFWPDRDEPLRLQAVSGFAGSHSQPSLSPDGASVVFVDDDGNGGQLWRLDFVATAPRQLTDGEPPDSRPRWSPGGDSILFMRRGGIWKVAADGGEAEAVIHNAYNPNWSPDGRLIVFERHYEIWIANADGSRQERVPGVARRELALAARWPAFSPDGAQIVYLDAGGTPLADLWRAPIDGGEPTRLTFAPAMASAPVWHPNGRHVIYSTQRGGSRTLWQVDIGSGISRPLLVGSGDDDFPDVSRDGRRLVFSNHRERFALVRSNAGTGIADVLYESRQMLLGPELSHAGDRIAFFALARTGGVQLFTLPLEGGTALQLSHDALATHAIPRWSADDRALYFYRSRDAHDFARLPVDGGEATVLVPGWQWNVANGSSVDPAGRRIAYSRLSGQVPVQTLIRDLATGSDQSFHATLEYPRWSAAGDSLLGALHTGLEFPGDVAICPLASPECRVLADEGRIPMWSADETAVYFVRGFGRRQELFVVPADGSTAERSVLDMSPLFPLGPFYDVTASGDVIWVRYEREASELWITALPSDEAAADK
jgi:Tol biopolymer transport system component/DNA-binding winged helix-turn-helix (wHTH) protein